MSEGARDDALQFAVVWEADHGVRFAAAGLPVGKHCAIVALKDVLDQLVGRFAVEVRLLGGLRENGVVGETLDVVRLLWLGEINLAVLLVHLHHASAAFAELEGVQRTDAHDHSNAFAHALPKISSKKLKIEV